MIAAVLLIFILSLILGFAIGCLTGGLGVPLGVTIVTVVILLAAGTHTEELPDTTSDLACASSHDTEPDCPLAVRNFDGTVSFITKNGDMHMESADMVTITDGPGEVVTESSRPKLLWADSGEDHADHYTVRVPADRVTVQDVN